MHEVWLTLIAIQSCREGGNQAQKPDLAVSSCSLKDGKLVELLSLDAGLIALFDIASDAAYELDGWIDMFDLVLVFDSGHLEHDRCRLLPYVQCGLAEWRPNGPHYIPYISSLCRDLSVVAMSSSPALDVPRSPSQPSPDKLRGARAESLAGYRRVGSGILTARYAVIDNVTGYDLIAAARSHGPGDPSIDIGASAGESGRDIIHCDI